MNFPAKLLGNNVVTKASSLLRHGGVSIRHIVFAFALSIALLVLYFNYFRRTGYSFPVDVIHYGPVTPEVWTDRSFQVRDAFLHAYHGYERFAFPNDELRPLSNTSINK